MTYMLWGLAMYIAVGMAYGAWLAMVGERSHLPLSAWQGGSMWRYPPVSLFEAFWRGSLWLVLPLLVLASPLVWWVRNAFMSSAVRPILMLR